MSISFQEDMIELNFFSSIEAAVRNTNSQLCCLNDEHGCLDAQEPEQGTTNPFWEELESPPPQPSGSEEPISLHGASPLGPMTATANTALEGSTSKPGEQGDQSSDENGMSMPEIPAESCFGSTPDASLSTEADEGQQICLVCNRNSRQTQIGRNKTASSPELIEQNLRKLLQHNEISPDGEAQYPAWKALRTIIVGFVKLKGSFVIDPSRRDDQVIKKVMTCNKDLIYKVIKNQKVFNGSAWRKLTKDEAFAIIRDQLCGGDQQAVSAWFGPELKFGFKNTTIDWLLGETGQALLERITSEGHVIALLETLDEQTEEDMRTNILSKLNHPVESQAFLLKKDKCTKLPCSSLGNKAACLYFYQRLLNRGLDYMITTDECPAGLRLRRAIALVRSRIARTEVGRRFLQDLGQPDRRGYLHLKKKVPVYFQVLPAETADN